MPKTKVAIIEDEETATDKLIGYLKTYADEHCTKIEAAVFPDAVSFLSGYAASYACVFMDIDLPCLNGLDGAAKLRSLDAAVPIVFVTNLAALAARGYEVSATGYLVKPYSYPAFSMAFDRALARARLLQNDSILVRNRQGVHRIEISSILYVEVQKHRLRYHTDEGTTDVWGSMPDAVRMLPRELFAKCGTSWLVGLKWVRNIRGEIVTVGNEQLKISRAYKKSFTEAMHAFVDAGGGSCL